MWHRLAAGITAFIALATLCLWNLAYADCTSDYQNAISLLKNTQQKISKKNHPKLAPFRESFRKSVDSLHAGHCEPELGLLSDYILSEQKRYPTAMPIED
jgi:hypothetical protein